MKTLKSLNKISSKFIIFFFLISLNNLYAENDPVDIWKIEKTNQEVTSEIISEENDLEDDSSIEIKKTNIQDIEIINDNENNKNNTIVGLYDPEKHGLKIDMWVASDGNEIKEIFKRFEKIKLSDDANEILEIALVTN